MGICPVWSEGELVDCMSKRIWMRNDTKPACEKIRFGTFEYRQCAWPHVNETLDCFWNHLDYTCLCDDKDGCNRSQRQQAVHHLTVVSTLIVALICKVIEK